MTLARQQLANEAPRKLNANNLLGWHAVNFSNALQVSRRRLQCRLARLTRHWPLPVFDSAK